MAQAKKVKAMLAALKVGDEVSTSGGILGKITKLNDQFAIFQKTEYFSNKTINEVDT